MLYSDEISFVGTIPIEDFKSKKQNIFG